MLDFVANVSLIWQRVVLKQAYLFQGLLLSKALGCISQSWVYQIEVMDSESVQKCSGSNRMSTREGHWFFVLQKSYCLISQCMNHSGWWLSHGAWWYFCRDQRCLMLASEFTLPSWVTLVRLSRSIELHYFDITQQTLRPCLEYPQV